MVNTLEEGSRSFPEDMLTKILVRLPVKSLLRFRCVSKSWYALIRSPYFANQHLMHNNEETVLVKRYVLNDGDNHYLSIHDPNSRDMSMASLSIPIPSSWDPNIDCYTPHGLVLLGSCNGIACLAFGNKFILCNPALQEFKQLPPRPWGNSFPFKDYCDVDLGGGFVYDPVSASYKVVYIYRVLHVKDEHYDVPKRPIKVDIYCLRTNTWRTVDISGDPVLPRVVEYFSGCGFLFDCAFHWDVDSSPQYMLAFDVRSEVFRRFEYPDVWLEEDVGRYSIIGLTVLNDCLAVLRDIGRMADGPHPIEIWVMRNYGVEESWTKDYVIGPYDRFHWPYFCWKNEWILVEAEELRLVSLALHKNETKTLLCSQFRTIWGACLFKESLISLDDLIVNDEAICEV